MAASKATGFEYAEPTVRISIGGRIFTQVEAKIIGEKEEYPKGGIPIDYTKLGLTDALVDSIWANLIVSEKEAYKSYDCQVIKGNLVIWQAGKEKEFSPELEEGKGALKGYSVVFNVIGR
jgi:hypothetical protein